MNDNSDNDFERILSESFNQSYNKNVNVPISTSEAHNVNDIFFGNEVKTECIICYEENIACIKCFQCTAVYCKDCLTKIASDSNKCICAIEIKANYSKLKKYNQELIKNTIEKIKIGLQNNRHITNTTTTNNRNSNNNTNNNIIINRNNSNSNSNTNNNIRNNTDSNLNLKLSFLKDLGDNKIYNIDFKSFCNKIGSNTPNFDYFWDHNNKTLTFYSVPNHNNDFKNIIFNYNILNAENQGEIYVWILHLLNSNYNDFKKNWNKIAVIMPQISDNNKTIMIRNIVDICRN